jgi:integration host factor subunit beta
MTKSELIARLATRYSQLVAKDAEFTVKMILDAMTQSLVKAQRIESRDRAQQLAGHLSF